MSSAWKRAAVAGAGAAGGVAGWTGLNRVAVRQHERAPDPVDPRSLEMPGDVTSLLVTVSDGARIHVALRGSSGPVVLLLHGITLSAAIWSHQFRDLVDAGCQVVAIDFRGHGQSPVPAGGVTIERLAADVAEVLEQLRLRHVIVVGHSLGGMVALRAFGRVAARVSALVLVATSGNALRGRGVPGLSILVAAARPILSSVAGVAARLPGPTLPANDVAYLAARVTFGDESSPSQVKYTGQMAGRVPVRVSSALLLEIARFDGSANLGGIHVPTSILVGDHDLMTPVVQSEALAHAIPGASLMVLAGCGHMVMLERPAELLDAVLAVAAPGRIAL